MGKRGGGRREGKRGAGRSWRGGNNAFPHISYVMFIVQFSEYCLYASCEVLSIHCWEDLIHLHDFIA